MTNHTRIRRLMASHRDLTPQERREVDEHISTCRRCAACLAVYQSIDQALTDLPRQQPRPSLRSHFYQTIGVARDMMSQETVNRGVTKLGDLVQISMGVPDLAAQKAFYEVLGFQLVGEGVHPWAWAQLTDGQNLILLNQDGNRYVGLLYMSAQIPTWVTQLEAMGIPMLMKTEYEGQVAQAIFSDANGLLVGLLNQPAEAMDPSKRQPVSRLGKFGEFSIRVQDLAASIEFWNQLGFATLYQSQEPYPWGILDDGMVILGLHQRSDADETSGQHFPLLGPTLTYFAPDMIDRIASLKADGIQPIGEIRNRQGEVANAVLQGPAGEQIFLFQGEI